MTSPPPSPATQTGAREPRFMQGLVLISLAWVSTIAAVVIGPVLPTIAQVFKDVPAIDLKIPLVATGPSLLVALLAIPFGALADKVGRRGLLLASLLLYGVAGMAPILMSDLDAIVASRLVVGLAEAVIMTTGTALISDYYQGRRREVWLAAQAGLAPLSAVFLVAIGGALGAFGWRTPFYVYGWGLVLIPLILLFIWEPRRDQAAAEDFAAQKAALKFSWAKPIWIACVIVFGMVAFMVTVVQFSFLVTERGMTSPQTIGLWSAFVTLANPLGALLFGLTKARTSTKLVIAFVLYALGFSVMSLIPTVNAVIAGAFLANLGGGFFLPTAITWILSTIPAPLRGLGAGLWTTANFSGQFLGPLVILGLVKLTGSLSYAVLAMAAACAAAALVTIPSMIMGLRRTSAEALP